MPYTLVRHSAYTGRQDTDFEKGVEEQMIPDDLAIKVFNAGGLLFREYREAYDAANTRNYGPGVTGLIPQAKGTFTIIQGVDVFVPEKTE